MNHLCHFHDTRDELLRALDLLAEHGFELFEPGGNRLELQTAGYWNHLHGPA